MKQNTAAKKKESADRVAQRLLSRKNKMAMKLAKSEALKTIECFKSLENEAYGNGYRQNEIGYL